MILTLACFVNVFYRRLSHCISRTDVVIASYRQHSQQNNSYDQFYDSFHVHKFCSILKYNKIICFFRRGIRHKNPGGCIFSIKFISPVINVTLFKRYKLNIYYILYNRFLYFISKAGKFVPD